MLSGIHKLFIAGSFYLANTIVVAAQPVESLAGTLPASADYGEVLAAIEAVGAEATSLTLYWDDLQKSGKYVGDPDWPQISQIVYPSRGIRIQLTFATIDTIADRRPVELQHLAWDDPLTVQSFVALAEEALMRMPDVDLVSIAIGNEVDGFLQGDAVDEYARFFVAARDAVQELRPGIPVTIKMTWPGLRNRPDIRALAQLGDAVSITWYPMDDMFHFDDPDIALRELSAMAKLAAGPWELSEVGYPSHGCGASSPGTQARFHAGLRKAADAYDNLQLVQRVWSHDISANEVASYESYYRTGAPCFSSFLSSLGIRTAKDQAKPAFETLVAR